MTLVQFAPDGRRLLVATDDGSFLWYELATGQPRAAYRGPGQVRAMAIRSDGGRIAALYQDKTCRIIDTETGELDQDVFHPVAGRGIRRRLELGRHHPGDLGQRQQNPSLGGGHGNPSRNAGRPR